MSTTVFQHKIVQQLHNDTSNLQIGTQLLAFLKMLIYCLVAIKFFQLIFLKYKKPLSVAERVEKKYKYSHNELFEGYSEKEAKLMEMTINNTIKNTQIAPSKSKLVKKGKRKQVSFKEQNNSYHSVASTCSNSEIEEQEYKDLQVQSRLFKETNNQNELKIESNKDDVMEIIANKLLKTIQETNQNGGEKCEVNVEQQSKVSLQTESTSQESTSPTSSELVTQVDKTQ